MKKLTAIFITILSLSIIACDGAMSYDGSSPDPIPVGSDPCPNPEAHTFWNEFKATIDNYSISNNSQLTDRLSFYSSYKSIIGSLTPTQVQDKITHVCPDNSVAVQFYNDFHSVIDYRTPTSVQTSVNNTLIYLATPKVLAGNPNWKVTTNTTFSYGISVTDSKLIYRVVSLNTGTLGYEDPTAVGDYTKAVQPVSDGVHIYPQNLNTTGEFMLTVSGTYMVNVLENGDYVKKCQTVVPFQVIIKK